MARLMLGTAGGVLYRAVVYVKWDRCVFEEQEGTQETEVFRYGPYVSRDVAKTVATKKMNEFCEEEDFWDRKVVSALSFVESTITNWTKSD